MDKYQDLKATFLTPMDKLLEEVQKSLNYTSTLDKFAKLQNPVENPTLQLQEKLIKSLNPWGDIFQKMNSGFDTLNKSRFLKF